MKKKTHKKPVEKDSVYICKLLLYFLLGSIWLKIDHGGLPYFVPLPIGFVIGLLFAAHEHFRIDRKIEYAILVASMFVSYWLPVGLVVIF